MFRAKHYYKTLVSQGFIIVTEYFDMSFSTSQVDYGHHGPQSASGIR